MTPTKLAIPEGYKLVPINPTDDMLVAGQEECIRRPRGPIEDCLDAHAVYASMLAAAPSPPGAAQPEAQGEQDLEDQLLLDRLATGSSWVRMSSDGKRERIDPTEVRLPAAPAQSPERAELAVKRLRNALNCVETPTSLTCFPQYAQVIVDDLRVVLDALARTPAPAEGEAEAT